MFLGSCSNEVSDSIEKNDDNGINELNIAKDLPLLRKNNGIGIIKGFNPTNPPMTTDSIETRWQEALASGMQVGRLQIDWPELEQQVGVFNTTILEDQLKAAKNAGLQSFLLISAYDSEGPVLPSDLEGLPLNDEQVISRFKNLMDWVIPLLVENEGYLISISNEVDANFSDNPSLNQELLEFLQALKNHIHSINERMAVTVTFAEGSLDTDYEKSAAIIAACDVACFNFYGAKSTATPPFSQNLSDIEIGNDIQRMLEVAADKNIVIQELGMHTDTPLLRSSQEIQRRFFEVFFDRMQKEERIKTAYVFQLVDWSTEATALFEEFFPNDPEAQAFFETFATSLESLGLINYEDGMQRPAWGEFIKWLIAFQ